MLTWFRESAPIRLKMKVAFGLQALIVASVGFALIMMTQGFLTPLTGTIVGAVGLVASLLSGFVLARAITEPYVATVVRMEGLAAGDLESPVAHTTYKDCVGRMTVAMLAFKEAAIARIRAENQAGEQRSRTDHDRLTRDAEKAEHAAQIDLAISSIAAGLVQLAEGNLVYRITTPMSGQSDRLRIDFNASMDRLSETMVTVGANAQGIRTGSKEVAGAADELARRTEKQAASLEETSAALSGITVTVKKTAEGALHARQVVSSAKSDAESSGIVAQSAIEAMKGIAGSSKQISQIIGVIDEIAFQTNLLALNAGVEAARAGDAGRGFAVVASEVRALAQRSAEAAKEIKSLISNSTAQVDQGVELVSQTGKALNRIVTHVNEISTIVVAIATSAQEQSIGLQEVNTAVTQMDQMTQQNAAMVEESTAASHAMMQESESLAHLLSRFKTGDDKKVIGFESAKQMNNRRSATRTFLSGGGGAGGGSVSQGSALRKSDASEAVDAWEEF